MKAANSKRRVWSTVADNDYAAMYGTSMACPHVSGVAALIIAEYGQEGFTAEQCREILLRAYRPVGGLADDDAELGVLGVGLLDAGAAFVTDPQSQPGVVEFGSLPRKKGAARRVAEPLRTVTTWGRPWCTPSKGCTIPITK